MSSRPEPPPGWSWMPLHEAAEVTMGQSPPGKTYNESGDGLPFFQGKAEFGATYPEVRKWTTHDRTKVARAGDVLLSVRAPVGPTNVAPVDCAIGRGLAALTARDAIVSPAYLLWMVRYMEPVLAGQGTGTTFRSVSGRHVRELLVPVAPRPHQDEVVEAVERMLSLTAAARSTLGMVRSRTDHLRAALYRRFFGEAADSSGLVELGSLLDRIEAGTSFKCPGHPAAPDKPGVLKLGAVTWGEFDQNENKEIPDHFTPDPRWEVRSGDLLIGRANTAELVGATALVHETRPGLYLSDKTLRLVPVDDVPAAWIKSVLAAPQARAAMTAVATGTSDSMRNISQAKIRAVRVPAPTEDAAERLAVLDQQVTRARHLLPVLEGAETRAETLRHAVLKAAFTGRLRGAASAAPLVDEREEVVA